jgi:esterase
MVDVGRAHLPILAWHLAFDPHDMIVSQNHLNGDHWDDWLASACPALVIRGEGSRLTAPGLMEEMVGRRLNASLRTLRGGHVVHADNAIEFCKAVRIA